MNLAIVKYNAGNTQSVSFALGRLGVSFKITDNLEEITAADKVIFPGVGEAASTMRYLKEKGLHRAIPRLEQPVLGICLGMQLMCQYSEENNTHCLGIFDVPVRRFQPVDSYKVPHTGWNNLTQTKGWLGKGPGPTFAYFVHSYYVPINRYTVAETGYIVPFSAAMQKGNFYAVQFHPERSAAVGEMVLKRFLEV